MIEDPQYQIKWDLHNPEDVLELQGQVVLTAAEQTE